MEYPQLTSLVPEGEHFDSSAIGEGVWLTVKHFNASEKKLQDNETELINSAKALSEANATIETLKAENTTAVEAANANAQTITAENTALKEAAATAKATNETQAARIVELGAQVAELGKGASGTGTPVIATADETVTEAATGKPGLLDADHPLNQYAAAQIAAKNKKALAKK